MVSLSESIGITSTSDQAIMNTSNGSPSSLSFAKVPHYLLITIKLFYKLYTF